MFDRFEKLTNGVSRIYKKIQKIKKQQMSAFGLKSTHAMCLYHLSFAPEGITAADLCLKCNEDKAAVSRILSELDSNGFLSYMDASAGKRYRAKVILTDKGKEYAQEIQKVILYITELTGKGITHEEREIFYHVLSVIADNIDKIERNL